MTNGSLHRAQFTPHIISINCNQHHVRARKNVQVRTPGARKRTGKPICYNPDNKTNTSRMVDNSSRSTGQLVSHRPSTFWSQIIFDLFYMLYVDDSAFFFKSRNDIEKRITLLSDHFARFGLEIHIGTGGKPSNTECVFSLPPSFFKARTILLTSLTTSTLSIQKKEIEKNKCTREDEAYAKCKET